MKTVEAVFVRLAPILEVRVAGRVIRTTDEHPFWVVDRGWEPARKLTVGDRLIGHDNQQVTVENVTETGNWERVYNLRVADHHTYFLGCNEWGFSVWAHNACVVELTDAVEIAMNGGKRFRVIDENGKTIVHFAERADARAFATRLSTKEDLLREVYLRWDQELSDIAVSAREARTRGYPDSRIREWKRTATEAANGRKGRAEAEINGADPTQPLPTRPANTPPVYPDLWRLEDVRGRPLPP